MEQKDMNKKEFQKNEEIEIDLGRVFRALMERAWLVAIVAVLCAIITFVGTFFFITPKYESAAMFYVNNSNLSLGDTSLSISSGDLTTSRNLVDSYIVILNTRETLVDVIDYAGASRTYKELREMIAAEAVNETEIFKVTVTSPDPQEAERIANAIAYILPKRIGIIIDGTSAKVVDAAIVPTKPSSPSYTKNTMIGFLLGFVLTVGVIALREIFDTTIRVEDDIAQCCKHPILASVPDMTAPGKGGSYYGYGSSRSKKGKYATGVQQTKRGIMGPNISFAASEAYKLLRTKLQFSFADENDCHIIGLSSALSGEGKSLTAVNLAYTLSQLDKKVLLMDCDMRRPTLAEKMGLLKQPGLSNYLTRQCSLEDLVQICDMKGSTNVFHVVSAGPNPPNPVELLSSARMKNALESVRKEYDYVILDLPPVGEVSDALAITKETDGMLLVVRQNYCDRNVMADAVRQFDFIQAKTLGVVFNCTSEHSGKGYYKHYYKRYYRGYGKSYENNDRSVVSDADQKSAK
jgi:capsular exopolysaccharide synthesis family protein